MQHHSGEHIVSGIAHARYGCENVGFSMGSDVITIDLSVELTQEQVRELEEAGQPLHLGGPPHPDRLPSPPGAGGPDVPQQEGPHRTGAHRLPFPGRTPAPAAPMCPSLRTGGPGEAALLPEVPPGVRIELVCGKRALDHLSRVWEQNHQISNLLSAKAGGTAGAVARLLEENQTLKGHLAALEDARFAALAGQYRDAGDLLLFEESLSPTACAGWPRQCWRPAAGGAPASPVRDGSGYRCHRPGGRGPAGADPRPEPGPVRAGGGKPGFVQGSVQADQAAIRSFFATL